jgi:hypothetical protein
MQLLRRQRDPINDRTFLPDATHSGRYPRASFTHVDHPWFSDGVYTVHMTGRHAPGRSGQSINPQDGAVTRKRQQTAAAAAASSVDRAVVCVDQCNCRRAEMCCKNDAASQERS